MLLFNLVLGINPLFGIILCCDDVSKNVDEFSTAIRVRINLEICIILNKD